MGRILKHAAVILALILLPSVSRAAEEVTIQGKDFYLDGKPWLPKGIKIEGFNRPLGNYESESLQKLARQGRSYWGPAEMEAIRTVFGGKILRFAVSQPGLDPQSPIYSPAYRDELLAVFRQARAAGFVIIPSMDAQAENGIPDLPCMPKDSTLRAWKILAPALINDPGVMFELFDEPCRGNWDQGRKEWAGEMQALIDLFRGMGAKNILLADGLGYGQWTNDLFPLLHDSLPNRLALAVHPYFDALGKELSTPPETYFQSHFGRDATRFPIIATEWNATETNGCVEAGTPDIALSLVRYLQRLHVGLIGWAIDSGHGKVVKDHEHFVPTDYENWQGCSRTPKGQPTPPVYSGGGKLLANFPNN